MPSIRPASEKDIQLLCSIDPAAQGDSHRRDFIEQAVISGTCFVAIVESVVVAYGVLEYSFFGNGFVSMLYVHPDHRRRGLGEELMRHMDNTCITPKIFTSTNLSNLCMQSLLAKTGYVLSGVIHNLDEGDPELVFFRKK
jgi:ribosomal protein S18 acetylase RimI-like enzyme